MLFSSVRHPVTYEAVTDGGLFAPVVVIDVRSSTYKKMESSPAGRLYDSPMKATIPVGYGGITKKYSEQVILKSPNFMIQ